MKTHSEKFIEKWEDDSRVTKKPYEENGRYFVELKREYIDIYDFLKYQIKHLSMGKHLDKMISKNYEILKQKDIIRENIREFWTEYLDNKMPWER